MSANWGRGLRGGMLAAVAGTLCFAGSAQAQTGAGAASSGAELRRQLEALAANPNSVQALVDAGRAALEIGDNEAALSLFSRAHQVDAQSARARAGLAAAYARNGQGDTALTHFAEAVRLGAPEAEIAGDRGLAYDLAGQPARAQQDYVASLRHREHPEVRRRLALSLAISGQRDAALQVIDAQVRGGDRAALRTRAFVHALSGDVRSAQASMPAGAVQAMSPFLQRLASLQPGDRAAAANLGRFPSGGAGVVRTAATGSPTHYDGALAFAGGAPVIGGDGGGTTTRLPVAVPTVTTRRRPGESNEAALASSRRPAARQPVQRQPVQRPAVAAVTRAPAVTAPVVTNLQPAAQLGFLQPHPHQPLPAAAIAAAAGAQVELAGAAPAQPEPAGATVTLAVASSALEQPAATQAVLTAAVQQPAQPETAATDPAAANLAAWNGDAAPPPPPPAPTQAEPAQPAFADVVSAISTLPVEAEPAQPATTRQPVQRQPVQRSAVRPPARQSATGEARQTAQEARPATQRATRSAATRPVARQRQPSHPARTWVQLGVSQNRAAFSYEINRMRRAAPEAFRNRAAHTAPIGRSHRLLVGPFASDAEARAFITRLRAADIQAMTWDSPAGQEVAPLAAGR